MPDFWQELVRELAKKAHREQRERIASVSRDDKEAAVRAAGWELAGGPATDFGDFWWPANDKSVGVRLDEAYAHALQDQKDKARKQALKDGTAVCRCNKCGADMQKKTRDAEGKEFSIGYYGLVDAVVTGGYSSDPLADLTTYTFSLCERCLVDLFKSFKAPPEIGTYGP